MTNFVKGSSHKAVVPGCFIDINLWSSWLIKNSYLWMRLTNCILLVKSYMWLVDVKMYVMETIQRLGLKSVAFFIYIFLNIMQLFGIELERPTQNTHTNQKKKKKKLEIEKLGSEERKKSVYSLYLEDPADNF